MSSLKSSGNDDLKKIINHLFDHPEDIDKVNNCLNTTVRNQERMYSPDKALAIFVSLKLTKWQYINLRESASEIGSEIYPSYYKVQQAKPNCYPEKKDVTITEDGAAIRLQSLLDLTVRRLLEVINLGTDCSTKLILISKWGFDGSSGQSNYKQKTETEFEDTSIFMASLVPIRLEQDDGKVVWENERRSLTYYCRPIMFKFTKETRTTVETINKNITTEIHALQLTTVKQVEVKHSLLMTMIDGKITSYLSETSTAVCDICKAKPSEMNKLEVLDSKENDTDMYQYGISSLHAWIRCMECLLHIAYRLDVKKWSCRAEDKDKINERKRVIRNAFKKECGLLIDIVKQGAGTTNDGNTARRFFLNPDTTARIIGINKDLIEKFHLILQTIASGERIELTKFSQFCKNTAKLYIDLYPWYYMPSSVHKLLVHGTDIIQYFGAIPIGKLSEEASEARNKDFRKYREDHSRRNSRVSTNEDILHGLLISSDPKITSLRPKTMKKNVTLLSQQARDLLYESPSGYEYDEFQFIDVDNLKDSDSE